jgi:hypothetical protein
MVTQRVNSGKGEEKAPEKAKADDILNQERARGMGVDTLLRGFHNRS